MSRNTDATAEWVVAPEGINPKALEAVARILAGMQPWWTNGSKCAAFILFLNGLAMMWLVVFGTISPWYLLVAALALIAAVTIGVRE